MEKWQNFVAKAVAVLISLKLDLEDNHLTVNAVLPFWQEFIYEHAPLSAENLGVWHVLKKPEEQCILIDGTYPQFSLKIFWAEAMKLAIANRQGKQNKEEQK